MKHLTCSVLERVSVPSWRSENTWMPSWFLTPPPTESSASHITTLTLLFRNTQPIKHLCKLSTRNWVFYGTCSNRMFKILSMAITPQLGNCRVLNHPFSIDFDHLSYWGQCVMLTSCILFSLESQSLTLSGADRPFSPCAHRIPDVLILPTPPVLLFVLPSLWKVWACKEPTAGQRTELGWKLDDLCLNN